MSNEKQEYFNMNIRNFSFKDSLVRYRHYYIIPILSFTVWNVMVITLFIIWLVKGKPEYGYYGTSFSSYIGYLGIQYPGLFLTCNILHSILFVASLFLEFYHRVVGKLVKFVEPTLQKRIAYVSLTLGTVAQISFCVISIVDYAAGMTGAHDILLGIFVILIFFTLILNFINYYMLGRYFYKFVNGAYFNKFMVSFYMKIGWMVFMVILIITMTMLMAAQNFGASVCVEWTMYFSYPIVLLFWAYDLMPMRDSKSSAVQDEMEDDYNYDMDLYRDDLYHETIS